MKDGCPYYRTLIPPALVGELDTDTGYRLQAHLKDCPECAQEHADMASWIKELGPHADVAVPHHFFLPANPSTFSLWSRICSIFVWPQWAWGASLISLLLVGGLLVNWSYQQAAPSAPVLTQADLEAFRSSLLQTLEERSRQEKAQWVSLLREEMKQFSLVLDQRQRTQLRSTINRLEVNMGQSLADLENRQKAAHSRTNTQIFEWLQTQQNAILNLSNQINHVAVQGEQRGAQTDATLAILFNTQSHNPLAGR